VKENAAQSGRGGKRPASLLTARLHDAAAASRSGGGKANEDDQLVEGKQPGQQSSSPQEGRSPHPTSRTAVAAERGGEAMPTRSTPPSDSPSQLSPADQSRLVERVARAMQAAPERGNTLRLRLRPPELGTLQVEVRVEKGVLTARLEAETSAARHVLLENLPQLRERLIEQGVRLEQFEVNVSSRHQGESQQQSDKSPSPPRAPQRHHEETLPEESEDRPTTPSVTLSVIGRRNLDIFV
jgi:flagellar hook-length control protein FliK